MENLTATLTSKGQLTLPVAVRKQLGLKSGDKLSVAVDDGRVVLHRKTTRIRDICSLLPAPGKPVSIEEMNEAIGEAATSE